MIDRIIDIAAAETGISGRRASPPQHHSDLSAPL